MKTAIIGAGICGLYLAWKLAERGEEVTVFEKREKIGKEACSGLFSERILEFVPQSQELIQNKIDFVLIHFPKRTLKINFQKSFFVMKHAELDRQVSKLAAEAGAKIVLGNSVDSLPEGFARIIGCDGVNSIVRKWINLPQLKFRLGIQGFVSKNDSSNYVETWPTRDGFIWRIPRGKDIEYGIMEKPKRANLIFDQFLKKNSLFLESIKSALVPQGELSIREHEVVTVCGDALGLAKPWSGGGVIWGLVAAGLLLKNFPDFLKYQKGLKKFFLPKIIFSKIATKIVYFLGFNIPWLMPKNVRIEGDFLI